MADDPYADWTLVKVEKLLSISKELMAQYKQEMEQALVPMAGMSIKTAQSTKPVTIDLNFQNAYGYQAAMLVVMYDHLACVILSAIHVGTVTRKDGYKKLENAGQSIRRLFSVTQEWKFTGVTRATMMCNAGISIKAKEAMGECPESVITGSERGEFAPEKRAESTQVQPDLDSMSEI